MVGNRYENYYGYTGLFPIKPTTGDGSSPTRDLRRALSELSNGPGSLFSKTRLVHGARLFVLDNVVYNGYSAPQENLRHQYLVMSITFDGELEALLRQVAQHSRDEWHEIFQHTWGYPDDLNANSIIEHVMACQVTTTFLYVDAYEADLEQTLHALAAQKELLAMVQDGQGMDREKRRKLVKETMARLKTLTTATPGSFTSGGDQGDA